MGDADPDGPFEPTDGEIILDSLCMLNLSWETAFGNACGGSFLFGATSPTVVEFVTGHATGCWPDFCYSANAVELCFPDLSGGG